jgi:hypothetical protein
MPTPATQSNALYWRYMSARVACILHVPKRQPGAGARRGRTRIRTEVGTAFSVGSAPPDLRELATQHHDGTNNHMQSP